MIKFLKYLHYRLYSWNLKTWGKADNPALNALLGVTFLFFLNTAIIPMIIIDMVFHVKLFGVMPKWVIAIIMLAYYYGLYFVFNHKKKYLDVCKQYKNERKNKKRRKLFYIWLYVVLSFLVPIFLILWLR